MVWLRNTGAPAAAVAHMQHMERQVGWDGSSAQQAAACLERWVHSSSNTDPVHRPRKHMYATKKQQHSDTTLRPKLAALDL
jgi:hypothetical protein